MLFVLLASGFREKNSSFTPKNGFVPDEATAIAVAEAVLAPVYGKLEIASERPFHAALVGDKWVVTGSVPCNSPGLPCPGGAAEVWISKKTARILRMTHYQ